MTAILASELYALSQGTCCKGELECHYCAGPCDKSWIHTDPPPLPFTRNDSRVKRPANPYVCAGCKLWRRKRITVNFLDGTLKDCQTACNYSWWITESIALALNPNLLIEENKKKLYEFILNPPNKFCLSLIDNTNNKTDQNFLQCCIVNSRLILPTTDLIFTLNNTQFHFNIKELKQALMEDEERRKKAIINHNIEAQGKEPGVYALLSFLGSYDIPKKKKAE